MLSDREPSLEDLLAEPIIRVLMTQDGVSTEDVVDACEMARLRLRDVGYSSHERDRPFGLGIEEAGRAS